MYAIHPVCVRMCGHSALSCSRLSVSFFPKGSCLWNIRYPKVIFVICGSVALLHWKMWRVSNSVCRRLSQKISLITASNAIRLRLYGCSVNAGWMIRWGCSKLPVHYIPIIIRWAIRSIIIMVICSPVPDISSCSTSWNTMMASCCAFPIKRIRMCWRKWWSRRRCWMYLRSISTGAISWDLITPATLTSPAKKGTLRI